MNWHKKTATKIFWSSKITHTHTHIVLFNISVHTLNPFLFPSPFCVKTLSICIHLYFALYFFYPLALSYTFSVSLSLCLSFSLCLSHPPDLTYLSLPQISSLFLLHFILSLSLPPSLFLKPISLLPPSFSLSGSHTHLRSKRLFAPGCGSVSCLQTQNHPTL